MKEDSPSQQPLQQAIQLQQQRQQLIPLTVSTFLNTQDAQKVAAAQLLQQAIGTDELIAPVRAELNKEIRIKDPIDILAVLTHIQKDPAYIGQPTRRAFEANQKIQDYLSDIGLRAYAPEVYKGCVSRFASLDRVDRLITEFNAKYPNFLEFQIAVQQGLIRSQLDVKKWQMNGKPIAFEWGRRSLQRMIALSNLPPVLPIGHERDGQFRVSAVNPPPQVRVYQRG